MFSLRQMLESDLDMVLMWRNQPDIRRNMYTTHVISDAEHRSWYGRVKNDASAAYFICEDDDRVPVGVVCFTKIDRVNQTAEWAYYSGDLRRRGIGTQMEWLAINYAFDCLGIEKLSCEVIDFNQKVIAFHRKFGFRIEGVFRKHIAREEGRRDVFRLALFRDDWNKYLREELSPLKQHSQHESSNHVVGTTYSRTVCYTREQISNFAAISGDVNPIHLADDEASKLGFKGALVHGMLLAAEISRILGVDYPGPGSIYLSQALEFRNPIYVGETATVSVRVVSVVGRKLTVEISIVSCDGKYAVTGEAVVFAPKREGFASDSKVSKDNSQ